MNLLFNRLFNIRTGEWPQLLYLYLLFGVYITGATWGETIVAAAFLQHVGVEFLPWILVVIAIASVPGTAVYTAFADRVGHNKLMVGILIIGIIGVAAGRILLMLDMPTIAYPLLYLLMFVPLSYIFVAQWYTYINSLYDTRSAKRIIPVLATSGRIGNIIAGLTMPVLNRFVSPGNVITIWLTALVAVVLLGMLNPYSSGKGTYTGKMRPTYLGNIREGFKYISKSPFLIWMALFTLLLMVLAPLVQYRVSEILVEELRTTENISNFIGLLTGAANLVMLPVTLFFLSRIISRTGIGNANLIFPFGNLGICGVLIFFPGIVAAALAQLGQTAFRAAFRVPIDNLLYNAVPLRIKGRARAFIGGFVAPVGSFVGAGLLLLLPFVQIKWLLLALIGILSVAYVISALIIRKRYAQALIKMLEQEDYSFLLSQEASDLTVADPATLKRFRKKIRKSPSHEFTIFMAQIISQIGGKDAVPILCETFDSATETHTRTAIIDILVASDFREESLVLFYTSLLSNPNGSIRQSALEGLERLVGPASDLFREPALKAINDSEVEVRIQAISALAKSDDFYRTQSAVDALDLILAADEPGLQAQGVHILGQINDKTSLNKLIGYLDHPEDEVRIQAAISIEGMTTDYSILAEEHNLKLMTGLLHDPVERIRQSILNILGHIGSPESYPAIIGKITDSSSQVRSTAADVLVKAGRPVIPVIYPQLNSSDPELRKMSAVVLSRIDKREFQPLISTYITGNLLSVYQNYGHLQALKSYDMYSGIDILQSTLHEQNQRLLDEIFYLLSAIHGIESASIIAESFRSENANSRANASEALETLTSSQTASLVTPLYDPDIKSSDLMKLSKDVWEMEHHDGPWVINHFINETDNSWLRTIMFFVLGEIMDRYRCEKTDYPLKFLPFKSFEEIDNLLLAAVNDPEEEVKLAAVSAIRMAAGLKIMDLINFRNNKISPDLQHEDIAHKEKYMLSTLEIIIFLKKVPFFQGMTIDQLKTLAAVCEEELFEEEARIFNEGDPGGTLYMIVSGKAGIEREGRRKGSFVRLATIEPHSYFGEMGLFDNSPRSASATALQDTLTLRLRREPLIVLFRQHPDLSIELINVLSQRLREADDKIAGMTKTKPRELHKLFDQFD